MTEYRVAIEEKSSIRDIDKQTQTAVNGIYNAILDKDGEIELLYQNWELLAKKRADARERYNKTVSAVNRRLLLQGINPEEDEIPEKDQKVLNEAKENLNDVLREVSLGIAKVKIALSEKGLEPSRFSPSMKRVKFNFTRL